MDNRPIGIFDSGYGGLTAVRALRERMPFENIIYFGDNGRAPYGGRTAEELRHMTGQALAFLSEKGVKAILAACGTVSSTAPELIEANSIPTLGVLEPVVRAVAALPGEGVIGVIATAASIRSGAYARRLEEMCPGRETVLVPCPDFVPLIESGHTHREDPLLRQAAEKYLLPLREKKPATLILGCTHYGLIRDTIQSLLGEEVLLLEASACAAAELEQLLIREQLTGGEGQERFYTSGDAEEFATLAPRMLARPLFGQVEAISPMETGKEPYERRSYSYSQHS